MGIIRSSVRIRSCRDETMNYFSTKTQKYSMICVLLINSHLCLLLIGSIIYPILIILIPFEILLMIFVLILNLPIIENENDIYIPKRHFINLPWKHYIMIVNYQVSKEGMFYIVFNEREKIRLNEYQLPKKLVILFESKINKKEVTWDPF